MDNREERIKRRAYEIWEREGRVRLGASRSTGIKPYRR
ncbi:hypothetical protein X743_06425 [Mesorhizobium sp. LNHC252B00]|nr:hypothetical protein X743_06425 [Mesorhizobium sp. LNHC252B00]